MPRKHLLIAGGGTGGHVYPGLAVAAEMEQRGWQVSWMGRREGMERQIAAELNRAYHALPARAVVGRGLVERFQAFATLVGAAFAARSVIARQGVRVVLGTGGFVSAPGVTGARLAGRPAALLEPNAEAGAANRWLSRWAEAAAVAYPETAKSLRCPVRETGVPVRPEFFTAGAPATDGPPRLLVLGGSQGALQLNRLLPEALETLAPRVGALEVVHQVGEPHLETTRHDYACRNLGKIRIDIRAFVTDVPSEMRRAELVISRAGAVTLAEICAAGRAALLVPLVLAAGHQISNAERLAATGGAVVLPSENLTFEQLAGRLEGLLADRGRLRQMGAALETLARPGAAREIADLLIEMEAA